MENKYSTTIIEKVKEFNLEIDSFLSKIQNDAESLLKFLMKELEQVSPKSNDYQKLFKQTVEKYSILNRLDKTTTDRLVDYLKSTFTIGNRNEMPLIAKLIISCSDWSRNKYEVYSAFVDDECIYIGAGITGRHKHCDSGASHNYYLNHAHFCRNNMNVVVVKEFNNKADAFYAERQLISKYKPECNIELVKSSPVFAN